MQYEFSSTDKEKFSKASVSGFVFAFFSPLFGLIDLPKGPWIEQLLDKPDMLAICWTDDYDFEEEKRQVI